MKNALIIFIKNPVLGKVKTRLASTIGNEKALTIYQKLLEHTRAVCKKVDVDKLIFYSDFIAENDNWNGFEKRLQIRGNLGGKMQAAFSEILKMGFTNAVIIGSDCLEVTAAIIDEAFSQLNNWDVVVGPAVDGGYYLLGMSKLYPVLFKNKSWSTSAVLQQTLDTITDLQLSFYLLPELRDIDEEKDLAGTQLIDG